METGSAGADNHGRDVAKEAVESLDSRDLVAYTDGSEVGGTTREGTGMLVKMGKETMGQWSVTVAERCSSYMQELTAILEAVEWLRGTDDFQSAAVVTDSRSLDVVAGEGFHRRLNQHRATLQEVRD